MKDEGLRSQTDYSEGQKEAAYRVLMEIANILNDYRDDILIIGGWVPDLLFPGQAHVGSIDVDILLNHLNLHEYSYMNIERILLKSGYKKHPEKYFTFVREVFIDGQPYVVDLDIMAGMYGGTDKSRRSQHIQGLKALKATGGNFAFEVAPVEIKIDARRPDGAFDACKVRVIAIVPFLIMKISALGRGKPKDAYDIYFCIKHYIGGVKELVKEFHPFLKFGLVKEMLEKLAEKFSSPEHAGPADIVSFLEIHDEDEISMVKRDAYEQIANLIELLRQ
jgi:hypothetical protein